MTIDYLPWNRPAMLADHRATAVSSGPGKIQRTSRLHTASVTGLSGGLAVIVTCSCRGPAGRSRALPPPACKTFCPGPGCPTLLCDGDLSPWPAGRTGNNDKDQENWNGTAPKD